ncbi:MAG: hypothetical protein JSS83_22380 [Cyanobacteria bacterium SZAS LIN-3]|nr:hypothetical protein [Cyanobacteria bacterium SZAS LIN-3]
MSTNNSSATLASSAAEPAASTATETAERGTALTNDRVSLQDLYAARTRQLAQTYFNSDFRSRLLQELESRA